MGDLRFGKRAFWEAAFTFPVCLFGSVWGVLMKIGIGWLIWKLCLCCKCHFCQTCSASPTFQIISVKTLLLKNSSLSTISCEDPKRWWMWKHLVNECRMLVCGQMRLPLRTFSKPFQIFMCLYVKDNDLVLHITQMGLVGFQMEKWFWDQVSMEVVGLKPNRSFHWRTSYNLYCT